MESLPGSKSVARVEGAHGTKETRRVPAALTARAKQEGKRNDKKPSLAIRESDWLIVASGKAQAPNSGEGANRSTQSAQATSAVRTTEEDWQTFLRAIAEKAYRDKHHRFGDLYRWLNQDVLRLCFFRLRKDAASGVDGVTFQEYEKNLEGNLADLEGRLRTQGVSSAAGATQIHPKGQRENAPVGHSDGEFILHLMQRRFGL